MRIILDTDKKTITVPWNYQKKLDEINNLVLELTGDESKKKTFNGYIDEIWKECLGTYAAVGREIGRSGSTIARYIKMKDVPQSIRITVENLTQG